MVVAVVLEELLIGTDYFGVFTQTLSDTGAQTDNSFHAVGGEEAVAEDAVGFLSNTVHTAGTLDEADDGPREVVVDNDGRVLEILTFAEHIGGDQDAKFFLRRDAVALMVTLRG